MQCQPQHVRGARTCARSNAARQDRLSDGPVIRHGQDAKIDNPLRQQRTITTIRRSQACYEPNCCNLVTSELCLTIQATRNNIQCCKHAFFTPSALFLSLYPMNSCEDYWKAELHCHPKVCLSSMHFRPVSLATGMAGSLVSFFFLSPRAVCITFCRAPVKGCCPRRFGTPYLDRDVAVLAGFVAIKLRPVQKKHLSLGALCESVSYNYKINKVIVPYGDSISRFLQPRSFPMSVSSICSLVEYIT